MTDTYPFDDGHGGADAAIIGPPCKSVRRELAIVEVAGEDAVDFLHGQFSADIRALQPGHTLTTAWCSPKGRVLFLPRVLRAQDGPLFLLLPQDQAAAFVKRLRMFVLRAKLVITERSATHGVLVIDGASAPVSAVALGVDGERRWLLATREILAGIWQALALPVQGEGAARLTDIARGEVTLAATLSDEFLPQELNLDLGAGVSFNKGCYPGQEIVARVKFRGTVKRRVQRVEIATHALPAPGTRLLDADQAHRGTVLLAAMAADQHCEALAVIDVEAGPLHVAAEPTAAVTLLTLP